jgi:5-(carboxyamino)imidazole ribonucleotide mutase
MPRPTPSPTQSAKPLVGIIMGSRSDLETMRHCADILDAFAIPYEILVVSAHRTPDWLFTYAKSAESRGIEVIIAGAGGAAHLPGMCASQTCVPVLGVPVESRTLKGLDSLLSIAQMPGGIPVGTLAIGKAGATNAGLLAASIVSNTRPTLRRKLQAWRAQQTNTVLNARELEGELKRTRRQLNLAAATPKNSKTPKRRPS